MTHARIAVTDKGNTLSHQEMAFPLNVYTHILLLEEGQAEYLHYGLFQESNTTLSDAQLHSTELILAQLPKPPCRILEVGSGLGTTLKLLTNKGYQIQGITPDSQQVQSIREKWKSKAPITCIGLEDFVAESGSFDLILFQESAQYIDPLIILNQALNLLSPSGSLLILDEFSLKHSQTNKVGLHSLDDFLVLADRFGFTLIEQQDLSSLAAPTLDYLLRTTKKYKQQLLNDLMLLPEQLEQLDQSNRAYKEKYTSGEYGYALLHFKKTTVPKWRIQSYEKQHLAKIQGLFERSFHHSISQALWQWKYASEHAKSLCIWEKDQLIAHYGGIPRDILFFGEPKSALQIGDVMVHPSQRGILTRSGPFFRMAATFLERYIGFGKPFLLGFGFPNERAMKVAEHLALYTEVEKMVEICWSPSITRPLPGSYLRVISPDNLHTLATNIDQLWTSMAQDFQDAIIGVRNWSYLLNRYLSHPEKSYQFLVIKNRVNRQLRGIIIVSVNDQRCDIIDILSPVKDIPLLLKHSQRFAYRSHCTKLYCQITSSFATQFKTVGSQCNTMDIRIPSNIWSEGPAGEQLKNRWWLMAGDMDFR